MADKTWKRRERQVASAFGTTRKPVSGRSQDKDGDDCQHPKLHIQHKDGRQNAREFLLFDAAALKADEVGKVPIVTMTSPNRPVILVLCRLSDLKFVAEELV